MLWTTTRIPLREAFDDLRRVIADEPTAASFPVDIWAGADGVAITAELPGVDPGSLDITTENGAVTIRGQRAVKAPAENARCLRREIAADGEFSRTLRLPFAVDAASAVAEHRDGILRLSFKRPEAEKLRRIPVKAA